MEFVAKFYDDTKIRHKSCDESKIPLQTFAMKVEFVAKIYDENGIHHKNFDKIYFY